MNCFKLISSIFLNTDIIILFLHVIFVAGIDDLGLLFFRHGFLTKFNTVYRRLKYVAHKLRSQNLLEFVCKIIKKATSKLVLIYFCKMYYFFRNKPEEWFYPAIHYITTVYERKRNSKKAINNSIKRSKRRWSDRKSVSLNVYWDSHFLLPYKHVCDLSLSSCFNGELPLLSGFGRSFAVQY